MSVGKINVWVPDAFKNNCVIDNTYNFVATVQNWDGTVLEWKGGRYQTRDGAWHQILGDPMGLKPGALGFYDGVLGTGDPGHVTFELPPGCYQVSASVHVWVQLGPKPALLGNLATHKAIVRVGCGEDACVTLYQPTGWHCGIVMVLETLIPIMASQGLITKEEKATAEKALKPILEKLESSESNKGDLDIAKTIAKRLTRKPEVSS
jgi:hypothetical protein